MIMDRLHALEYENDQLKRELDNRCPPPALSPSKNIVIHDTSGNQSTYFKIAVFTDRPGLHDLMDFGRALLELDDVSFCDVTLRSVSWSEVWGEKPPLKRDIVYMTGIVDCSSAREVITALQRGWGDSVTPLSMSGADVYSDAQAGQVYLANWVQQTSYHDVWSSLLGWGDKAILLDLGSMEIRTREECIWDDLIHEPLAGRAIMLTAYGIDQIELYGEADGLLQRLLSDPIYINSD